MSELINIERRTGVKDADIDSFVSKATLLEEAIRGLRDGTLDPKTLKIEGFDCDTDDEKAAKQVVKEAQEKKRREAALALDLQRKKEEKELWWAGAKLHVGERTFKTNGSKSRNEDEQEEGEESENQRRLKRYTADYSRWDEWVPQDPATLLEKEEESRLTELKNNEEFEKNNAEFCNNFLDDMKTRSKAIEKKKTTAESLRLKGNQYYKKKDFSSALSSYNEALKMFPYSEKTIMNMAQCYIRLAQMDEALEFLSRVIYLDESHAKAWNRRAFVLKEAKGDLQGAFESSATAVKLAPDNEDILSLHRELEACLRTQQEEKELSELNESQKTVLTFVDKFVVVVKEQIEPEFESSSFAKLLPATKELLRTFKVQSASCQVHLQVYFRLSKALELLCTMVMRGTTNLVGVDINNDQIDYFLELLRSMIFEQKPSIEVVVRMGTANYLIDALPSTPSAARAYFILRILMLCGLDPQSNASIKISLLSSISFLRAVCDLMITTEISRVMSTALAFIHRVVLSAEATTALKDSSSFIATSLGGIFHKLRINTDNPNREDLIKAATESLVACSQMPLLRPFFLSPLDSRTISSSQSLAAFLAESFTLESDQVCNELAILINLTHEGESMQLEIAATGILPGLIAMIKAGDSTREKTVFLRGLILVARLSSLNSTKELLLSPSAYRSICKGFAATARYAASESETYLKDQCGHWIKLLANLSPLSPSCKEIAKEERLIQHLLLIFPTPREELGEITPVSVTLMPKGVIPSALLIGNASRCLMPLADDPALNGVLYTKKSQLGVEKLICSMATCTDMRVRKNIAILLAKGCRVPGVREKVDRLRGMQMLVELQDKF